MRDMKGMKSAEFVEMVNFIQKYHKFALWLSKEDLAEAIKLYPNLNEHGFNIKYIDSCYDSRFIDVWSVSFRGLGHKVSFHTNTDLELPYDTLFEWVMAYLKREWKPTDEQYKSIAIPESDEKFDLSKELRASDINKMAWDKYPPDDGDIDFANKRAGFIEGLHHAIELINTKKQKKK